MWRVSRSNRRAKIEKQIFTSFHNPIRAIPRVRSSLKSRFCFRQLRRTSLSRAASEAILPGSCALWLHSLLSRVRFRLITYNPILQNIFNKCDLQGQVPFSKINSAFINTCSLILGNVNSKCPFHWFHSSVQYLEASTSINTCNLSELNCPLLGSQRKCLQMMKHPVFISISFVHLFCNKYTFFA